MVANKCTQAVHAAVSKLPGDASLGQVERSVIDACGRAARWFNNRRPEVIVVAYEHDPRTAALLDGSELAASEPPRRPGGAPRRVAGSGGGGRVAGAGAAGRPSSAGRSGSGSSPPWQQRVRAEQELTDAAASTDTAVGPQQQQQQEEEAAAAAPAGAPVRKRRRSTAASEATQEQPSGGGVTSKASPASSLRRGRRSTTGASPQPDGSGPPPLQVLPDDLDVPVYSANPRQDPSKAGPDADLAYD
jgi:hypothetical protein